MWGWLRRWTDAEVREAASRAATWFRSAYPRASRPDPELIERDAVRLVFRVWYHPEISRRPTPYVVAAVDRASGEVVEIDLERCPRYRKRGHA